MLRQAIEHYQRQQRITALGLVAARRVDDDLTRVAAVVAAFQVAAAEDAAAAVPLMLAEQGIDASPVGQVNTRALAGVAGDGRPLVTLFEQAATPQVFDTMVMTQVQDAARMSASVASAARPAVTAYVRMLNPPSCSRCAILAGATYRSSEAFARHPRCDCRHVPTTENLAGDLTTDPLEYFESLSAAEQERVFTKAGARAINDGADIRQVVNARRGARGLTPAGGRYTAAEEKILRGGRARGALERVDVYGQKVFITTEGITRRGVAGKSLGARRGFEKTGGRYETAKTPRLMPESIYEVASSPEEARRLLRLHGYIL